jgi:xanthine dehydrogenase YagS FAD-binding subunit
MRSFAVSVAVSVTLSRGVVTDARIVFGGVAAVPLRATGAEAALRGKRLKDGMDAACQAAVEGARPLSNNNYKVESARGILAEALASLT